MAEEDLFRSDHPVSASEDEGDDNAERRHCQLLEAVSSLAGKKRRKLAERTEASVQVSEFNLSCEGIGEKLVLPELLGSIRASSSLGIVKKQLNRVKQKKSLELPLSKEESERVVREAAYNKTSKAVAKWEQVVQQNRRAEQLVFPLKQEQMGVAPIEEVLTGWKARTPLEQEIFSLLHKTQQPVMDPLLTPLEEASLRAMSLEEAQLRRAELQKARALQSYYEAKARREKKIKSKKYHRVLQKGRSRKALKEFEVLRKLDPEAALTKLEEMERSRIEERMSLKHQNKGKWARSRAIMAKYNLEARKAMQEQLSRNKELTQKVPMEPEGEEEGDMAGEDLLPDSINEVQPSTDGANPWMLGKPSSEVKDSGTQEDPKDPRESAAPEDAGNEGEEMSEDEILLQDFEQRRCTRQQQTGSPEPEGAGEAEEARLFDELLSNVQTGPGVEQPAQGPEGPLLSEQLGRRRTLEEIDALGQEEGAEEQERPWPTGTLQESEEEGSAGGGRTVRKAPKQKMINLQAVLAGESHVIQCPAQPISVQDEEEEAADQRLVIKEAFAGDDVIADFLREKHKVEQAGKPQAVDLVLPGWGEWGGTGLRPSARKRKRFLIKPVPGPPRRDRHLPHVIISQQRNVLAAAHQVNEVPFPFDRRQQFERSMRAPVGPTWNTQQAFQKLTAPRILTQPGHIIQPISAEDASPQSTVPTRGGSTALPPTPQRSRHHQHPHKKAR
ncbi:U3 small nucleolar RNA-associated protein 14 homolog A [Caretta caretta]|uniref:U3 small nucleolar RNA-associated protein 14 homolog A n=1 Tax=Caretta caretta TaxID=8467 RepID=UPI00209415BC|nr:U3 small nucleolar RNA-associated protein 14 homolog A [Caretta caretta]XP_048720329.1 U3 small nucleolar RNA-associated protein 14 homolog A [Caretta caretta]XP_048720330.1 U3 small nucleolar RNA-associated protein 14 homolog A [Caretta caretta]